MPEAAVCRDDGDRAGLLRVAEGAANAVEAGAAQELQRADAKNAFEAVLQGARESSLVGW